MTEILYMNDSYLKEWDAKVIKVTDRKYIVLDKTAFYPKGGGQPCDEGTIARNGEVFNVIHVGKFSGDISHEVDKPGLEVGDEVHCTLDWERRYTFMRYHTASHLLSNILFKRTDARITGNQIGLDKTRMDFSMENYSPEKLQEFVEQANEIIEKGAQIKIEYMTKDEVMNKPDLARLAMGLPENIKKFRIIKIGSIDEQVDGGTHVNQLSEIGQIEVIKTVNKGKDNRRVYFKLKK